MSYPFSRELAAERIADLRRQADHDRIVAQVTAQDRPANRDRPWKVTNAEGLRTAAT